MGVVHKLKPEIINFILKNKTDAPSLSCRSLSVLVQDAFNTKVSKSAVNKVLKDANLSSPVGRRTGAHGKLSKKQKKRYKLSETKKRQIFADIAQQGILSDLNKDLKGRELIDGAGAIFLKAAEWELSREPVLEKMLQEYCQGQNSQKLRVISEMLGLLKVFHIESLEGLVNYSEKGLWEMSESQDSLQGGDVLSLLDNIKNRDEFYLKFSLRIPQIFTLVEGFRFTLKDGTSFFIDGQNASIWKNVQKGFSVSLGKATDVLAKMLNNVHSVIINSISPKELGKIQESIQFGDFFQAFENVHSKRIQKIELIGEEAVVLGEFDEIPQSKKFFIAGVWAWEKIFQSLLDARKALEEGKTKQEFFGKDVTYKEVAIKWEIDGKARPIRGILLYELFQQVPFLILITNFDMQEKSAEECIAQYYQRWPNLEKGSRFLMLSNPDQRNEFLSTEKASFLDLALNKTPHGRDPVWLAIDQLLFLLDRFSRRQFFSEVYEDVDFSTMQNRFYRLPGKIVRDKRRYCVELSAPQEHPYLQDLFFAIQRLNESGVKTFTGQKVAVSLI